MLDRWLGGTLTLAALMATPGPGATAQEQSKYPGFYGQWSRTANSAQWDPSKPPGLRQLPPLTPEFQAVFEVNAVAVAKGEQTYNPQAFCIPPGMPRMMIAYEPMEVIVTPETTYIRIDHLTELRRIFTDGRDWPARITPSFEGYSIGRWIGENGRYDVLEVETGAAQFRSHRDSVPSRQPDHPQGAVLSRSGQSRPPARRGHHLRPRLDAALDGRPALHA
jgi:hypothetical protein